MNDIHSSAKVETEVANEAPASPTDVYYCHLLFLSVAMKAKAGLGRLF
jgi:hypothetical protein